MKLGLGIPVLLLVILNCPDGVSNLRALQAKYPDLTYRAVIELSNHCFVLKDFDPDEPADFGPFRDLIKKVYLKTSGGVPVGNRKPYTPFGYKETGGLIVKFSNTPDNTIPAVHFKSSTWSPLFKRHSRN